jgi:hypothetical protein
MAWVYLVFAILFEVSGATSMKRLRGQAHVLGRFGRKRADRRSTVESGPWSGRARLPW